MNSKAQQFIKYIEKSLDINTFVIKELSNDLHATLFYCNMRLSDELLLKSFILIDDSQNILIRVNFKDQVDKQKIDVAQMNLILNQLNQQYPLFKFYHDEVSQCIVLDMMYVAHSQFFEPKIIHSYLVWITDYATSIYQKIDQI
ncbi:MAG: hypothetical protein GKC53_05595 [Neisseriaceae bacterium]|nr:MAG: hypothetical protein GKC53_05595 [Neisseriaceae bacterium]